MNELISSMVRHGLTSVGGSLVAKGLITATVWDQVTGSVIVLAGVAWSIISKLAAKKAGLPDTAVTDATTTETK